MDELIQKYSALLQSIYDKRTAGDHTFSGILHNFESERRTLELRPHHRDCKTYGHDLVISAGTDLGPCDALRTSTTYNR